MTRNLIPFMLAILFCAGCVTSQKCLNKFGQDTLKITFRDTIPVHVAAPVPPDSIEGEITSDTLQQLLSGKVDSLTHTSDSKDVTIKFWYNKYTKALQYKAKVEADTIYVTKEVPVEVTVPCPPVVVVDPDAPRGFEKLWKKFQFFSAYLVLGGLLVFIGLWLIKRRA